METIHFEKHEFDNSFVISADDVFKYGSESNKEILDAYQFGTIAEKYFNYWAFNTPTAYGNCDYSQAQGYFFGYLCGKQLDMEILEDKYLFKKGSKVKYIIDKFDNKKVKLGMNMED